MATDLERKAKTDVNDKYHRAISSILPLATGALVLPIICFRDIVGISGRSVIGGYVHGIVSSWVSLLLSITCCILFYFFSAAHTKALYDLEISRFWKNYAGAFCRWSFWLSVIFFGFGVLYLVLYVYLIYFRFY